MNPDRPNRDHPIFGQGVPPGDLHIFITGDGCARLKCAAIRLDREENLLPVWGDAESMHAHQEEDAPEDPEFIAPEIGVPEFEDRDVDLPADAHREGLPPRESGQRSEPVVKRLEPTARGSQLGTDSLWSWTCFFWGVAVAIVLGLALLAIS
jgi:hypothetical protein